jgi:hypothetical protein
MEEQVATLAAELAALKELTAGLNKTTAETFYFLTIPLMILIHAGFLSYEMGASRAKNALASGGSRTSSPSPSSCRPSIMRAGSSTGPFPPAFR